MATSQSLTGQMRAATREIHNVSDKYGRSCILRCVLRNNDSISVSFSLVNLKLVVALTDKQLYGRALMLFYYVYAQLESVILEHKDHEAFRGLYEIINVIARADGIAKDLRFYLGEDWSTKYQPTQAVQDYVKHLQDLEKKVVRSLDGAGNHVMKFIVKWLVIISLILVVRASSYLHSSSTVYEISYTIFIKCRRFTPCCPISSAETSAVLSHFEITC
ncbi:Endoglucanase E1 [Phytophthora nicotianae]|uniref:Endoglucanase E1 n=1 Tax=Phytophthora nicotianae TaxID=4792 RepID=A0A0W8D9T1_PHYNI|nr:Endoglucanase E1 [Phytophthora nicotianae]